MHPKFEVTSFIVTQIQNKFAGNPTMSMPCATPKRLSIPILLSP
jgi:hypothetical protein